jgi:hypothetical protein
MNASEGEFVVPRFGVSFWKRPCIHCKKPFSTVFYTRRYCSSHCRNQRRAQLARLRNPSIGSSAPKDRAQIEGIVAYTGRPVVERRTSRVEEAKVTSLLPVVQGRPAYVRLDGWNVNIAVHDAYHREELKKWRERLVLAHPDGKGTHKKFIAVTNARDSWMASEVKWYAQYGLEVP